MDEALLAEVRSRLESADDLDPRAGALTLAALAGELEACLEGRPAEPVASERAPRDEPCRAYVRSIAVEGFRGIGPEARLELSPGPGLTLVVGRNGSGKSSFAEALELLLTGDNLRWSSRRNKVWKDGWRNLHHSGRAAIAAEMLIDGESGPTRVSRAWDSDDLDSGATAVERPGRPGGLADLGWRDALVAYRPFLSYNELGAMLEEGPSRLYDALASILGLEELVDAARALAEARKARQEEHKAVRAALGELRVALEELDDERAVQCLEKLKGTKWDLEPVESLVTGEGLAPDSEIERLARLAELPGPDPDRVESAVAELRTAEREVEEVRGTDAEDARRLAHLLEQALGFHDHAGDGDCPVCGRSAALDAAWHRRTRDAVGDLRGRADAAQLAHRRLAEAERQARALATPPPPLVDEARDLGFDPAPLAAVLWKDWAALREESRQTLAAELPKRARELAAALERVREEARVRLGALQDAWRDVALRIAAWLPAAEKATAEKELIGHLSAAEKWLKKTTTDIRNDRFRPIKDEVLGCWESLRAKSSVELADVKFEGTATRRRINLDVTVDGIEGAALGVMSQGELHALALALFLPRATLAESPFRFLVIDDPVQAMDPARVDGLARTLEEVARDRQVVVFTHDNRLPEAVRRLEVAAEIQEIRRRPGSEVEVRRIRGPVERYFDDAHALARTDELPASVMERVVPGLCRQSLEAAALEVIRRRRLGRGDAHAEVEELLERSPRLLTRLALALFDDPARAGDVLGHLQRELGPWAADAVQTCNRGAHGVLPAGREASSPREAAIAFIRDVERLTGELRRSDV